MAIINHRIKIFYQKIDEDGSFFDKIENDYNTWLRDKEEEDEAKGRADPARGINQFSYQTKIKEIKRFTEVGFFVMEIHYFELCEVYN